MTRLGQCQWCPWDCPSPDVAACLEPDPDTPSITNPKKPRKWVEDILPDLSHYEEPNADTTPGG